MAASYTELYCRASDGSNLNAGSTNTAAASLTYASGSWVSATRVFTVASGDPVADGVAVDDIVSVYADGSTETGFVGFVTARTSTTITVHATRSSGTSPADGTSNRTLKKGGAWKGPNAAVGFPWGFVGATLSNAAGLTPRVTFIGTFNFTGSATHNIAGPVTFQGATAVAGDGGKATIQGSTTLSGYTPLYITGDFTHLTDFIFSNNGIDGGYDAVNYNSYKAIVRRCTFANIRGAGLRLTNSGCVVIESLAYNCCLNNGGNSGAFFIHGPNTAIRCVARDNPGSNGIGFTFTVQGGMLKDCVSTRNGGSGVSVGMYNYTNPMNMMILGLDSYQNTGDGLSMINDGANLQPFYIENSNFLHNGGWGINGSGSGNPGLRSGVIINCGFGSGTEANTSGTTNGLISIDEIDSVIYPANVTPWNNPTGNDFSIVLAEAKGTGRGAFSIPTTGHPDIGAAQHEDTGGGGGGGGAFHVLGNFIIRTVD